MLSLCLGKTQQLEAAWSLGTVVGPGVGGILAEPADSFPRTFSKLEIFRRCIVAYAVAVYVVEE